MPIRWKPSASMPATTTAPRRTSSRASPRTPRPSRTAMPPKARQRWNGRAASIATCLTPDPEYRDSSITDTTQPPFGAVFPAGEQNKMDRRGFVKVCTGSAALASANWGRMAVASDFEAFPAAKLTAHSGVPLKGPPVPTSEALVFSFPLAGVPCFLIILGERPAGAGGTRGGGGGGERGRGGAGPEGQ